MGFFNWLFGSRKPAHQPTRIEFQFLIYEDAEKIDTNVWYQKASWNNKNYVSYRGEWSSDWKWSDEGKVKVVGLSKENRSEDLLYLAQEPDFKLYLENETDNPVNENARKVMASASVVDECVTKQVGYLPDEIANKYAGVELDIRPASIFLPTSGDMNLGLKVALLVRSARYLKKKKKDNP